MAIATICTSVASFLLLLQTVEFPVRPSLAYSNLNFPRAAWRKQRFLIAGDSYSHTHVTNDELFASHWSPNTVNALALSLGGVNYSNVYGIW